GVAEGASAEVIGGNIGGRSRGDSGNITTTDSARNTAPVPACQSCCQSCRVARRDNPESELDQPAPSTAPRGGQPVKLTPPASDPLAPRPAAADANPLAGKPLRYLIGADSSGPGHDGAVTVVSYDTTRPAQRGISIAYGNLFDEHNTGRYGPYLHTSDTAAQYNEGQIDPRGPGWEKNLREQFTRRKKQGFEYIELDNADAYAISDVTGAIELAASHGLKVIAKNPGLLKGILSQDGRERPDVLSQDGRKRPDVAYVAHPNIHGVIVEKDAGRPADMEALR